MIAHCQYQNYLLLFGKRQYRTEHFFLKIKITNITSFWYIDIFFRLEIYLPLNLQKLVWIIQFMSSFVSVSVSTTITNFKESWVFIVNESLVKCGRVKVCLFWFFKYYKVFSIVYRKMRNGINNLSIMFKIVSNLNQFKFIIESAH